ncbi:MAG: ABC transporter ATP-binding protein [Chloroflexi bacterium]|nr:ABC transporter ATP-binding protein [Chloroflexota bacterium]
MSYVVEARGIVQKFGPITAIDGLDLRIQVGNIYGLLGPNGSGKSTFIRLALGLLKATSGTIAVFGAQMPDRKILRRIGYMPQAGSLYLDLTVRENVSFFATLSGVTGRAKVDEALELVDLAARRESLVGTLSGGMRQRVSLACALVHHPGLLLLDEPTVGVDPRLRRSFWQHFRRLAAGGTTIVVSSHVMDEADRCDKLGFMRQGKLLAEGTPADLRRMTGQTNLEEAFLCFAEGGRRVEGIG